MQTVTDEMLCKIALTTIPGIGPKMYAHLMSRFESAESIFNAPYAALKKIPRFSRSLYEELQLVDFMELSHNVMSWVDRGVSFTSIGDEGYPESLLTLRNPPPIIYSNRSLYFNQTPSVAIVGSRRPSKSISFFTEHLARKLVETHCTIISGMARGIDRAAHLGALRAGGLTIAVLGGGVLVPFPPENRDLHAILFRSGILISEQIPFASPNTGMLIARNRLIAALADLVIVMQADKRGGSMETGMKAIAQDKPLFVFDIPESGNRFLIRRGGIAFRDVTEISNWLFRN